MHKLINEILIISNSREAQLGLKSQLEPFFTVSTALSFSVAFKALENSVPNCILTDYDFPDTDGQTFLQQLKKNERLNHIPVIVLTTITDTEKLLNILEAGADDFVAKDSDFRLIKAKINALICKKRVQDELTRLKSIEGIMQIISIYNHEFNNPLTIAIGNVNWLRKNNASDDQLTRIGRLTDALGRMTGLIKKIRDLRDYVEASYAGGEKFVKLNDSFHPTKKAE